MQVKTLLGHLSEVHIMVYHELKSSTYSDSVRFAIGKQPTSLEGHLLLLSALSYLKGFRST